MSIDEAHNEVRIGGQILQSEAIESAVDSLNTSRWLSHQHPYRTPLLPGIYFPQMGRFAWLKQFLKSAHHFQTHKARIRRRAARSRRQWQPSRSQSSETETEAVVTGWVLETKRWHPGSSHANPIESP